MMWNPLARLPRLVTGAALATVAATATACSVSPATMDFSNPLSSRHDYRVELQFADALNLPIGAQVTYTGLRVGRVAAVTLTPNAATVTARIQQGTQLPAAVQASIVQDTLLGESYVRLARPAGAPESPLLHAGSVLPVSQTTPPRSVEGTLTVLANYFGTGSLQQVSATIAKVDTALPPDTARLGRLSTQIGRDVSGVAGAATEVDRLLDSLNTTARTMRSHNADFQWVLTPYHMRYWHNQGELMSNVGSLLPAVQSLFTGGYWMIPMMDSISDLLDLVTVDGVTLGDAIHGGSTLLTDHVAPMAADPQVVVQSIVSDDGRDLGAGLTDILRMLGGTR
ncbi:hypothetical protein GCM10023147_19540 [Tsukamurella soli]|uniref:Mce/MlaD domain-containing protein n=1 Tax=Tsukamurella soli TaxID=644556 RepID=A0ABP8JHY7_9ACTN